MKHLATVKINSALRVALFWLQFPLEAFFLLAWGFGHGLIENRPWYIEDGPFWIIFLVNAYIVSKAIYRMERK